MTSPRLPQENRPTMLRHVDYLLPIFAALISAVGVIMVYSATRGPATELLPAQTRYLERHLTFVLIGLVAMFITAWIGHRFAQRMAVALYGGLIFLLVAVLVAGVEVKGARAWFQFAGYQLQPSEFGKLVVIVVLAAWFGSVETVNAQRLLVGLAMVALPTLIILKQPDLGTVLVYGAITAGMTMVAGVKGRHLFILALLAITGTVVVLQSDRLASYQVDRLLVFIDGESNSGARYNLEQAQIAIGNGGLTGKGLFQGTQNNSDLVPEQQTDFIFTVIGEETGFVGSVVVLGLMALLLVRIWRIGQIADDRFGRLLSAGVFSMILFQIFQSVGMAIGIMPITGIPLPLVSYGGSSVLSTFLALGLVQSVHMRRHDYRYSSTF
ncbi:MAG: rod shape-determining protein RodA [Acidimicrobiales bacterium]|nr:rod shape-determining protein RodA [Acidimicrobiales bacterium]